MHLVICWLLILLLCGGCAGTNKSTSTAHEPSTSGHDTKYNRYNRQKPLDPKTTYVHTVKYPGESLSIIAAWYTGDLQNWKKLAQVNPTLNPSRIFIGNKIRIPRAMMKTHSPMPQKFVNKFIGRKSGKTQKAKPAPAVTPEKKSPPAETGQEDVPLLFGPK